MNEIQSDGASLSAGAMAESILGCKWSLRVIALLREGTNRPGAMQRSTDGLSAKVLNERLAKLQRFGLVEKVIYPVSPPHVEYNFTERGREFLKVVDAVQELQRRLDRENGGTEPL